MPDMVGLAGSEAPPPTSRARRQTFGRGIIALPSSGAMQPPSCGAGDAQVALCSIPSKSRGRREDRVPAGTHGPRAAETHGAGTTGSAELTRPSLRDGFNPYSALSLVTGLDCHHPSRNHHPANLIPASGDQDHTPSASAQAPLVWQHRRVHRIPASRSVTIGQTSLLPRRDGADCATDLRRGQRLFRKSEATRCIEDMHPLALPGTKNRSGGQSDLLARSTATSGASLGCEQATTQRGCARRVSARLLAFLQPGCSL